MSGIMLLAWTLIFAFEDLAHIPHIKEIDVCIAAIAGIMALVCMGHPLDIAYDAPGIKGLWARLSPLLEVAELAVLCYLGFQASTGNGDYRLLGFGALAFGFAKHIILALRSHKLPHLA